MFEWTMQTDQDNVKITFHDLNTTKFKGKKDSLVELAKHDNILTKTPNLDNLEKIINVYIGEFSKLDIFPLYITLRFEGTLGLK